MIVLGLHVYTAGSVWMESTPIHVYVMEPGTREATATLVGIHASSGEKVVSSMCCKTRRCE